MIKCLPEDVRVKLRSGVAIPSLQQCVEELALNSIDAGATCVGVRMDLEAFKVQVIDNGAGMNVEDMACVGNRYYTSKCNSLGDLDNLRFYGFRGEAIASIVSLATLVEISSRAKDTGRTLVRIFKDGKGMDVFEKDTCRPAAGTTVVICNFFHNMPVRRKRMDHVLEGERIRRRVEAISLMHPSVSFTLKNDCTGAMLVQLPKARDTYHRFVQIHTLARAQKLGEIQYTRAQFEVIGYLGREGHYNNSLQFLYINDRLLLMTRIHKLLNSLLRGISSPNQRNDLQDKLSATRSPKQKRSQELHGIYIINIKCSYAEYDICLEPAKTLIEFKDWDGVLLCLEEAVKAFLHRENLVLSQDDLQEASPRLYKADGTERENNRDDGCVHAAPIPTLASSSVHRKQKGHIASDIGVCQKSSQEEISRQKGCFDYQSTLDADYTTGDSIEKYIKLSKGNVNSYASLNQTCDDSDVTNQVDCQVAAVRERTLTANKKIRLSCPFIHKCLQEPSLNTRTDFVQLHLKHKISLSAGKNGSLKGTHTIDPPAVCLEIHKVVSKELGSLDKFRRIHGKPAEPKVPSLDSQTHAILLQTNFVADHSEERLQTDFKDMQEEEDGSHRTTTHSEFTKLKNASGQTEAKQSLAGKLNHLKQRRKEDAEVESCSVSQEDSSLISIKGLQDGNNNACEMAPEEGPCMDWIHHYDASTGKTVYINKVTGISRYEEPSTEETRARCTSDVTNMAVSVVSQTGMEYRCYPFQAELVLPFLPKSRSERVLSSAADDAADNVNACDSLSSMYSKWNNPVFVCPPEVGVDISSGQAGGLAVKVHNILFPYRFSKAMIHSMKVINQVDNKFLACLINTTDDIDGEGNLLVMLDQHAAHERVRLENLIADSFEENPNAPGVRRLCSSTILPPIHVCVTEEERRLLRSCQAHLWNLGLEVTFSQSEDAHVLVGKVPVCFVEKENNELRRKRPSVIKRVVEDYLQEQMELLRSTGRVRGTLPLTVLKVLASLACHGAIKFNDRLNRDECHSLVASLSSCQLPFQCAHGRPSIAPLVDVVHLDPNQKELQKPNLRKLRRMYKAWKLYGNK
ncbi:DNA mismatch repair protein Mlh3 isoform X2 [Entelurus aequoreus]|uniref:DNA mismatch repair protein Mlh3 isoform X2 n=1 Tax=Entelurus aequoreus TaxID=161455 RepID=UPI002B1D7464|nr:DNA mismatch repair protein Mlh3 isoform X2 [Entelurus aequoreus]